MGEWATKGKEFFFYSPIRPLSRPPVQGDGAERGGGER